MNANTVLNDFAGKPLSNPEGVPLTLGFVCCQALVAVGQQNAELSGEKMVEQFTLAQRIAAAGDKPLTLSAKEITRIQELLPKCYGPAVVGPAFLLLEPPAAKD